MLFQEPAVKQRLDLSFQPGIRALSLWVMIVGLLAGARTGVAQTSYYWDTNGSSAGTDGTGFIWSNDGANAWWTTSADGTSGTVAWVSGSVAVFSAGTGDAGTVDLSGVLSIGGLKFEDGAVTLRGGLLSLAQNATLEVAESRTAVLEGVGILGDYVLTKSGKGKLTLTGDMATAYSGLIVRGGTMELGTTGGAVTGVGNVLVEGTGGNSSGLNPTILKLLADDQISDSAVITVASRQYNGSLLDLNGFKETIGGLVLQSFTGTNDVGVKTGAGGVLTVLGDIYLHNNRGGSDLSPNTARDVLISGSGHRGLVAPDSGYLDLGGGVRTITVAGQAVPVSPLSDATIEVIIQNGGIIKAGAQMLILSGTNTYTGGTTIQEGTLRIGAGSTSGSIVGDVINQSILEFHRSNATSFSGNINGAGVLNKMGAGTLTLTGVNSYSGLTSILEGAVQVQKIGMAGVSSGSNLGSQGVILVGGGTVAAGLIYAGTGETTDKVLRLMGTTGTVTLGASGSGAVVWQNALEFVGLGARTIVLNGTSTADNTLKGGISNATDGGVTTLEKSGAGTWVLEGDNTYTGVTTINGGILKLEGDGTLDSPAVKIQNGTLAISGNLDLSLAGDASVKVLASDLVSYALLLGGGATASASSVEIDAGRTLQLKSHVGFLGTGNNLAATISGGNLDLGNEFRLFVVNNSSNADPELTISSALTGTAQATLMKAGSGRMVLTQGLSIKNIQVNVGRLDLGGLANTVAGNLQVGFNNSGSLYYGTSGGTLSVGSGNSADVLDVGVVVNAQAYSYASGVGIMDLRGSQQFNVNVGRVRFGVHTSTGVSDGVPQAPSLDGLATPSSVSPSSTEVYLATNNTITATSSFILADAQSASVGGIHKLQFGEGNNVVNTPLLYVGYRKGSGQATIRSGGSLEIRGVGAGAKSALYVGYSAVNTGAATVSFLDMTGGRLVADLSSLTIGWKSGGSGATAGSSTGSLILSSHAGNQVSVSGNVVIGYIAGAQTSAVTFGSGTLSMAGGTFDVGGNVELATIGTSGSTNANLSATGLLQLTGGTFTVQGNITHADDALNRGAATVTLDGGTLDMTGGSIGGAGANAITFNVRSGSLASLGELNAGGNLVKSTVGILKLTGTSSYTGGTQVNEGMYLVNGSHTGGSQYTVASGAVLGGTGQITPTTGQDVVVNGRLVVGDNSLASPQAGTLTIGTSGGGAMVLNSGSTVEFDLLGAGSGTWNAADKLSFGSAGSSQLEMVGTVTLQVANPTALTNWVAGDAWQLFDWSGLSSPPVSGSFVLGTSFTTILLGTGKEWDLSRLYVDGSISIAPEPGRMMLVLVGFCFMLARRRRK
ncbi:autotransporter-associated beta strand repeat-containing protein [Verrucomicrobium sp. BvORR034]|uniref:beta strand repeat-containing protein n=1 Tax=Verrucomicrobium sp. BvORR034 TaxID=1396418 RepID=UPI0009DE17F3|nr:autotransporter-associated beta strand repeat-containing protein [Verrucomicrobium sp. BvORR034]